MVRLYRRDETKSNPGGRDVWKRVDPRELSNPVSAGARAVAGRSYGGAPRYGVRTEHPIQTKRNDPRWESPGARVHFDRDTEVLSSPGDRAITIRSGTRATLERVTTGPVGDKIYWFRVDGIGQVKYGRSPGGPRPWRLENYSTPPLRKINYATPPIRKINAREPSGKCIQSVISTLDEIDLPDTAQALRDIFGERYGAERGNALYIPPRAKSPKSPQRMGITGHKANPVMILVNAKANQFQRTPESRKAALRYAKKELVKLWGRLTIYNSSDDLRCDVAQLLASVDTGSPNVYLANQLPAHMYSIPHDRPIDSLREHHEKYKAEHPGYQAPGYYAADDSTEAYEILDGVRHAIVFEWAGSLPSSTAVLTAGPKPGEIGISRGEDL